MPDRPVRAVRRVRSRAAVALVAALALAGCGADEPEPTGTWGGAASSDASAATTPSSSSSTSSSMPSSTPSSVAPLPASSPERVTAPALDVQVVTRGLEHGWDIGFLPDGRALISQRPGRFTLVSGLRPGATSREVRADFSDLFVRGEGGLLGMVIHPDFATSRQFTTCQNHQEGGNPVDIRLVTWQLAADGASASRVKTLLAGLPTAQGGRHSGCRPTIAADGALLVGTGDTANGRLPQDLTSLGGKVLRLDLQTGQPLPDNPFATSANRNQRYVLTYGHRNVQGVAVRPRTGQVYTAEHGPAVSDEVNLLRPGANYGWDPSQGGSVGGYDENVPMTDLERFPDAVPAVWETGSVTQAVCAAAFLSGPAWGDLDGALAVTALKGAKLVLLRLDAAGAATQIAVPTEVSGRYGRLRAARLGPDGALYVTTSNGDDDALLRITRKAGS